MNLEIKNIPMEKEILSVEVIDGVVYIKIKEYGKITSGMGAMPEDKIYTISHGLYPNDIL